MITTKTQISKQQRDQLNRYNMQQRRTRLLKLIDVAERAGEAKRAEQFRKQLVELEEKLGMGTTSQSQGLKKPRKAAESRPCRSDSKKK